MIGVPKTIDNDLGATDYTFGFDTAVNIAMEAIDRLHTTADSHHRVLIVEVMGRHAGWIAFHAGLAGGANVILIPEQQFDVEQVCELVGRRFESHFAPIVVVAEGAQPMGGMPSRDDGQRDAFGHVRLGGIGHWLEGEIERRTGKETRATVLGHVQRGGTPTAFDRVLATRFGLHAIDAADAGEWGTMAALRGTEIELVRADRGDGRAEDGAGVALRRGGGLLRMIDVRAFVPALVACGLLLVLGGCGEEEGTAKGATVTAYVELPALRRRAGRAGGKGRASGRGARSRRLPARSQTELRRRSTSRRVGANARRATEDSSAVAYVGTRRRSQPLRRRRSSKPPGSRSPTPAPGSSR